MARPMRVTPKEKLAKEAMGVEILTVPHGANGYRFALETKIKVAEFLLATEYPYAQMAGKIGICPSTLGHWVHDYKDGKYHMGNVTQINRKTMRASTLVLQDLKSIESQQKILEEKLRLLKEEGRASLKKEREEAEEAFGEKND